jgi:histidinol-phosphate phosphatase family protein
VKGAAQTVSADIVIPTVGRPSLADLVAALAAQPVQARRVLIVDDRGTAAAAPLSLPATWISDRIQILGGPGRGPAAARNRGWRAAAEKWIVFLDDDVIVPAGWSEQLAAEIGSAEADCAGIQGRIVVPLPSERRPTDWERNVAGLRSAVWACADIAYRADALAAVGGFDERFPRAYREDSDLGLRLTGAGWRIERGSRRVVHPVRPAGPLISLSKQAGNADDVLMRVLHGRDWRRRSGATAGRIRRHLATAAAGLAAAGGLLAGAPLVAAIAGAGWLGGTAELALRRIAPGPADAREVGAMLATSAAMPFVASWWWLTGIARLPSVQRRPAPRPHGRPDAVLLDRDGTLVVDVPYNRDPERVRPMPGAREAIAALRSASVPLAVVSNQSGIGRGLLTDDEVQGVNRRIEELLGPIGSWHICPHAPNAGCGCRKPAPGLLLRASEELGIAPERCAVVGDIGADVDAARAVGARAILVPTSRTRPEEVMGAPETAPDLTSAVQMLLGGS